MQMLLLQEEGDVLREGLHQSRIVGVLRCARDGSVVSANDAFLLMAGYDPSAAKAGTLRWESLLASENGPDPSAADEPYRCDLRRADGETLAVLVEIVAAGPDGWTAFVVDHSAHRAAELALTRAREILEQRNSELLGTQADVAAAMAEQLTQSERALARSTSDREAVAAELERQRQQVEALAAHLANANRELDAFSYSVSHDLRSPLRSIDGFSRVLLSQYAPVLDERGRDYLQRVRSAAQRMSQLLDDLLTLARTSRTSLSPAQVDLSAGALQIAAELQQRSPGRAVEWKIQPGLVASGDRALLRVVFENLLDNAFKFTSRLEERSATIEFGAFDAGGTRVYFVRDNGAGFDMRYADQLFGVFQRLHSASEFEGTGVGLATVQRIIHRHSGEIWADAAAGGGATFYFTLGQPRPAQETKR